MLGIFFRVNVKPRKRKEFIEFIKWDAQICREKEPGTLRFDLYQDPTDKNAFFVYEAYRDKAAFKKHQLNEPYKEWESCVQQEMLTSFRHMFQRKALCALASKRK